MQSFFNPNRLEYRKGTGCIGLGIGLFLSIFVVVIWAEISSSFEWPLMWIGIPLTLGTIILLFGRKGLVFERDKKVFTRWLGLRGMVFNIPIRRKRIPMSDSWNVTLDREIRSTGGDNPSDYTVFPLKFGDQTLAEYWTYWSVRKEGEKVAKFLERDLIDNSPEKNQLRKAGSLDQPLLVRLREEGEFIDEPSVPKKLRIERVAEGETIRYLLPKFKEAGYLASGIGCGIACLIGAGFLVGIPLAIYLKDGDTETIPVLLITIPLFSLLSYQFVLKKFLLYFLKEEVQVTRGKLSVRTRFPLFFPIRLNMQTEELEELVVNKRHGRMSRLSSFDGNVVCAISDRKLLEFGQGLDDGELKWLRDDILYWLAIQDD